MIEPVHVIGASGRTGQALCQTLIDTGIPVVAVVRDLGKWVATGLDGTVRQADVRKAYELRGALADATRIVSCTHARFAPAILDVAPATARMVLLGSTRKFTRWPDDHGNGVLAGEAAFLLSGRSGVMLHPTMIYGAQGEDNVQRLAALLRKVRILPLPGGGRYRVQPIHQSDVTRCIVAALDVTWDKPETMVIAGPAPLPYADFVRTVASAAGVRQPFLLPFPTTPLIWAAGLTRHVKALPTIRPDEIRRLTEDKAFNVSDMKNRLGVVGIPLRDGLAQTFGPG